MKLSELLTFLISDSRPMVRLTRRGPGAKKVGKILTERAVLPTPLSRQLRRQQLRLAAKGRALI